MTTATAGTISTVGYSTVGPLIARVATQVGIASINPLNKGAFDAFASVDPNIVQLLELLNTLGPELTAKVSAHLRNEVTFVTAGSALSWLMPDDFVSIVPETAWDMTGARPMFGSVSAQQYATLKASASTGIVTNIPYRIQGNRLVFPVAPSNGLTITIEYISSNWIQTAASITGPDAQEATANTDYVLFDPTLVMLGLRCKFLEAKGKDTTLAYTAFADRIEWFQAKVGGSQILALDGGGGNSDGVNVPESFP
jgi:hypothetical protein